MSLSYQSRVAHLKEVADRFVEQVRARTGSVPVQAGVDGVEPKADNQPVSYTIHYDEPGVELTLRLILRVYSGKAHADDFIVSSLEVSKSSRQSWGTMWYDISQLAKWAGETLLTYRGIEARRLELLRDELEEAVEPHPSARELAYQLRGKLMQRLGGAVHYTKPLDTGTCVSFGIQVDPTAYTGYDAHVAVDMQGRFVYLGGRVKHPSGELRGVALSADSWKDPEGVEKLLQGAEQMVRNAAEGKATQHDKLAAEIQAELDDAGLPSAD